jgi:hypothetical protein
MGDNLKVPGACHQPLADIYGTPHEIQPFSAHEFARIDVLLTVGEERLALLVVWLIALSVLGPPPPEGDHRARAVSTDSFGLRGVLTLHETERRA